MGLLALKSRIPSKSPKKRCCREAERVRQSVPRKEAHPRGGSEQGDPIMATLLANRAASQGVQPSQAATTAPSAASTRAPTQRPTTSASSAWPELNSIDRQLYSDLSHSPRRIRMLKRSSEPQRSLETQEQSATGRSCWLKPSRSCAKRQTAASATVRSATSQRLACDAWTSIPCARRTQVSVTTEIATALQQTKYQDFQCRRGQEGDRHQAAHPRPAVRIRTQALVSGTTRTCCWSRCVRCGCSRRY